MSRGLQFRDEIHIRGDVVCVACLPVNDTSRIGKLKESTGLTYPFPCQKRTNDVNSCKGLIHGNLVVVGRKGQGLGQLIDERCDTCNYKDYSEN